MNHPDYPDGSVPRAQALSNGRLTTIVTGSGGGFTVFEGLALTRWAPDPTRDADGPVLYLRDLDTDRFHSMALQPAPGQPDEYALERYEGVVAIRRADEGVGATLEICVSPHDDVDLRRLTLTNASARLRRLEVTTFLELVLNTPAADAAHPAFSKLFVQTELLAREGAILAWRRPRAPDDEVLWAVHLLRAESAGAVGALEVETDRMRFLGRGRGPGSPAALDSGAHLSGSVGNVLDPCAALRRVVELQPGESARLLVALGAARSREEAQRLARRLARPAGAEDAFAAAAERARSLLAEPPIPDERARRVPVFTGAPLFGALAPGAAAAERRPFVLAETSERPMAGTAPRVNSDPPAENARPLAPPVRYRPARPSDTAEAAVATSAGEPEPLRFFNGIGGFSEAGDEYVIRLEPGVSGPVLPPLPWTHVVANEEVGFIVSERGAGHTWSVNSRENRLTPWSNDPVSDPHGEAIYLRDDESGIFWSPTPGPTPAPAHYEARWGFGRARWRTAAFGLEQEVTAFVPRHGPLRVLRLRLTNRDERARRLSVFSYAQWVLGLLPHQNPLLRTALDPALNAILAVNPAREFAERVAFAAAVPPRAGDRVHMTADRAEFLGARGDVSDPAALRQPHPLRGRAGADLDPCAAFQLALELPPGESAECAFLLGEAENEGAARAAIAHFGDMETLAAELAQVREFWADLTGRIRVHTPSPALDTMINGWLTYQDLACRIWARSAFYQSGGAFGFRDQLQDAAALVYVEPALTRRQIVLHAGHQFREGDVLHWWHPPTSKGIRTRFSDDLLWLPYVTSFYLGVTGDAALLDERAPWLSARALERGEDEAFLLPTDSGESASVYEHCCRALDRSLATGAHGLPLIGTGDWNDGMNRVGREGRGESVWLGFFLYSILEDWAAICGARQDSGRAERYRRHRARLRDALELAGWDGAWYRRAYYDDGAPLGSAAGDECRIDAIAQSWAVLSGAAPPARAARALDSLERFLVREDQRLIALLTPPFDGTPRDPGYIKGYLPGVRENGGQYTHGALWAVRALAEAGRRERAAPLLEMLSPISHARTPQEVAVYRVEPYVVAADVYGVSPHVGRGGWTWYTGSAGWMLRVALESILGLTIQSGRSLSLRPCIPAQWPGFTLTYRLPGDAATYDIRVNRANSWTTEATLDGRPLETMEGAIVAPLLRDGRRHELLVNLGDDVGPIYTNHRGSTTTGGAENEIKFDHREHRGHRETY